MAGSGSHQLGLVGALRSARELLGVTADAEVRDVTRAYRRRARGLHPDRSADPEATQQFQALHAAYRLALAAALASTPPGTPPGTSRGTPPDTAQATDAPADDGVWVVAGPVHVQPPRHAPTSRSPSEGRP